MLPTPSARLTVEFFGKPTRQLARNLLGTTLVRRADRGLLLRAIIVEVEAYLAQGDLASHSHRGPGRSNASMFEDCGTLYVYPIHSRHCMNVVSESVDVGAAILIRAAEPLSGLKRMWKSRFKQSPRNACDPFSTNRATDRESASSMLHWREAAKLTRGPGRVCEAFSVDRRLDGLNLLTSDELWLEAPPACVRRRRCRISRSSRIGISKAQDLQLRWFFDGHRFVSGKAADHDTPKHWSFFHDE